MLTGRASYLFFIFVLLFSTFQARADCEINTSADQGCRPQQIAFSYNIPPGKSIETIHWDFGDGGTSTENFPVHIYSQHGSFTPELTIKYTDGTECIVEKSDPIRIFDLPDADFEMPGNTSGCLSTNEFCFEDLSSPGADSAPINMWQWDFEDGDTAMSQNPCKSYFALGEYNISLEVTDANGCSRIIEKDPVYIVEDITAEFSLTTGDGCSDSLEVWFYNQTDTSEIDLKRFLWDFDDGNVDSSFSNWDSVFHIYTVTGGYSPMLIIENEAGCIDTFDGPSANNIYDAHDLEVLNSSEQCFKDNNVRFRQEPVDYAEGFTWRFDDPASGRDNMTAVTWEPSHSYTYPGNYSLSLSLFASNANCEKVYCNLVSILGPVAYINDRHNPDLSNDTIAPRPYDTFPNTYTDCSGTHPLFTPYVTIDTIITENAVLEYIYCFADTASIDSIFTDVMCPDTLFNMTLIPTDSVIGNDTTFQVTSHTWAPGDPMPDNPFMPPTGTYVPHVMHDTNKIKPDCQGPNLVHFTNNSLKFRGYHAPDDTARGFHDQCINPSYPGASDSLVYWWDFGNQYADSCISTPENPDLNCLFSTEKEPAHLYRESGCYNAKLTVTDTITGCSYTDDQIILMQPPDAGWDAPVDNMTYKKHEQYDGYRRGIYLSGEECFGPRHRQSVSIDELVPSCYLDDMWFVLDSANQARKHVNCIDTLVSSSGQDSIVADTQITYDWINIDLLRENLMQWEYQTGGCKSIGVIVKSGDCLDTAWYHNYKCFRELEAKFSIVNQPGAEYECSAGDHPFNDQVNKKFCQGDTLRFTVDNQQQDSIQYYIYHIYDLHPNRDFEFVDTLPVKQNSPDSFADLSHTFEFVFENSGKYLITGLAVHASGCELPFNKKINIGNEIAFGADKTVLCGADTVHFTQSVHYYKAYCPFADPSISNPVDPGEYWGFPDSLNKPEKLFWDLNGDGNIDATGPNPSYYYDSVGAYTVTLYAVDSTGCTTSVSHNQLIKVVDVKAGFTLSQNSSRVNQCAPILLGFRDTSYFDHNFPGGDTLHHTITSHKWIFGDGKPNSVLPNPSHVYSNNGAYEVTLHIETSLGCIDSVTIDSFIMIDGPVPRFEILTDTFGCAPHTVTFRDLSEKTSFWQWHKGDGSLVNTHGDSLVELTWDKPGIYEVTLAGGDSVTGSDGVTRFCQDTWPDPENASHPVFKIHVLPENELNIEFDEDICIGSNAIFSNYSDTAYDSFEWILPNNDTVNASEPRLRLNETGTFPFILEGKGAPCPVRDTFYVNVHSIDAAFDFDEISGAGNFQFIPTSAPADHYIWNFGDNSDRVTRFNADPVTHSFNDAGYYEVCMQAVDRFNCTNQTCKTIGIDTMIYIPNVFSPTGDRINDYFFIDAEGIVEFELIIYNRWGEKVFESTDIDEKWNGLVKNTGRPCEPGTYYFRLNYRHLGGENQTANGTITLLR